MTSLKLMSMLYKIYKSLYKSYIRLYKSLIKFKALKSIQILSRSLFFQVLAKLGPEVHFEVRLSSSDHCQVKHPTCVGALLRAMVWLSEKFWRRVPRQSPWALRKAHFKEWPLTLLKEQLK